MTMTQFIVTTLLSKFCYKCDAFSSGIEALEAITHTDYDLVLMVSRPQLTLGIRANWRFATIIRNGLRGIFENNTRQDRTLTPHHPKSNPRPLWPIYGKHALHKKQLASCGQERVLWASVWGFWACGFLVRCESRFGQVPLCFDWY